jgi:hypothetical protein
MDSAQQSQLEALVLVEDQGAAVVSSLGSRKWVTSVSADHQPSLP